MGATGCAVCIGVFALAVAGLMTEAVNPQPQPDPQKLELHQLQLLQEILAYGTGKGCSYRVIIKTSCRSPRITRDMVAISFGDAYNNQVYAPRLDDVWSRTFERCSTDTFDIVGPCDFGICYLYLWRDGPDGWIPDWVQVYDPYYARYLNFYYGSLLPPRIWYGFNNCPHLDSDINTTIFSSFANAVHE